MQEGCSPSLQLCNTGLEPCTTQKYLLGFPKLKQWFCILFVTLSWCQHAAAQNSLLPLPCYNTATRPKALLVTLINSYAEAIGEVQRGHTPGVAGQAGAQHRVEHRDGDIAAVEDATNPLFWEHIG